MLEVIFIFVLSLTGNNGLTGYESFELLKEVSESYQNELGIQIVVSDYKRRPDRCEKWRKFSTHHHYFSCWQKLFKRRKWGTFQRKLLLTAPLTQGEVFWLAGIASGICQKQGLAFATAELFNHLNEPRWEQSKIAVEHELGHLLGSEHTEEISVMNPDPLPYAGAGTLQFSESSKNQIYQCLGVY